MTEDSERDSRRRRRRGGRDRAEGRGDEATVPGAETAEFAAADSSAEAAPAAAADDGSAGAGERDGERDSNRRRGRGGRDRNRSDPRDGDAAPASGDGNEGADTTVSAEPAPLVDAVAAAEPPLAAPAIPATAAVVAAPIAAVAPIAPPAPPVVERYDLPLDQLRSLAADAGLDWVNSDTDKIRTVREAMAAEPVPVRVPRELRPPVLIDEGPLVLVETRKDLAQLKLPFESDAARG